MHSDDWIRAGCRSDERTSIVPTLIFARCWRDEHGRPVGVSVDFEYARDVHIDIPFPGWATFLREELGLDDPEALARTATYFDKTDSWHFTMALRRHEIDYHTISFD